MGEIKTLQLGICGECGKSISPGSYGYCYPCAREVHARLDAEFPFVVKQAECMDKLREKGYRALFVCGFEDAKKAIDEYLKS